MTVAGKSLAKKAIDPENANGFVSGELLKKELEPRFLDEGTIKAVLYDDSDPNEVGEDIAQLMMKRYLSKRKEWNEEISTSIEKTTSLRIVDRNWTGHIDTMDKLREGIHLRSYANKNPLQDYVNEGYSLFGEMNDLIAIEVVLNLLNIKVEIKKPEPEAPATDAPAAE